MATTNSIRRGKQYKWLINGVAVVGIAIFFVGMYVDRVLPALILYAVICGGSILAELYVRFGSDVPLEDERQRELHRLTSHVTFWAFGYGGFFGLVGMYFLDVVGAREMGVVGETLMYAYAVVVVTWAAIYLLLRYGR